MLVIAARLLHTNPIFPVMYFNRRRGAGNGSKSSAMGLGTSASRVSPDTTARRHGFYSSEYRNFNRSFGRGRSQPYQLPQQPSKDKVLTEAGRLAAEYLVSKGLLPLSLLPPKWQSCFGMDVDSFQEFRSQEGEGLSLHPEGRSSALTGLENPDAGTSRKRSLGDYDTHVLTNSVRGRRKMGSFQTQYSHLGHDNGRSGLLSDEPGRSSPDKTAEDAVRRLQQVQNNAENENGGMQHVNLTDGVSLGDGADIPVSELEKQQFLNDISSDVSSASRKNCPPDAVGDVSKESDDLGNPDVGVRDKDTHIAEEDKRKEGVAAHAHIDAVAGDDVSDTGTDLLKFCNFAKVPTRIRSSLTSKGLKIESLPSSELKYHSDNEQGSTISSHNPKVDETLCASRSNQAQEATQCITDPSNSPSIQSTKVIGPLDLTYSTEQDNCLGSQSFPGKSYCFEQDSPRQGFSGLAQCYSVELMVKDRDEKTVIQQNGVEEGSKGACEFVPTMVAQAEEYPHFSNFSKRKSSSPKERTSPGDEVIMIDQESSVEISSFPKAEVELCTGYTEEKQLHPNSFKICDLNLMEASDMNENHDSGPILFYPVMSKTKKDPALVDIGTSGNNSSDVTHEYSVHGTGSKEVEVIDLENDSAEEDRPFKNLGNREETVYTSLESFPSHAPSTSDIPDAQDGYGLMISELLGNNIPNCSSVPEDITLHNEIGLHNGEGIMDDDDPIYMSLDEIPISFLRNWEQPPQEYQKPF